MQNILLSPTPLFSLWLLKMRDTFCVLLSVSGLPLARNSPLTLSCFSGEVKVCKVLTVSCVLKSSPNPVGAGFLLSEHWLSKLDLPLPGTTLLASWLAG